MDIMNGFQTKEAFPAHFNFGQLLDTAAHKNKVLPYIGPQSRRGSTLGDSGVDNIVTDYPVDDETLDQAGDLGWRDAIMDADLMPRNPSHVFGRDEYTYSDPYNLMSLSRHRDELYRDQFVPSAMGTSLLEHSMPSDRSRVAMRQSLSRERPSTRGADVVNLSQLFGLLQESVGYEMDTGSRRDCGRNLSPTTLLRSQSPSEDIFSSSRAFTPSYAQSNTSSGLEYLESQGIVDYYDSSDSNSSHDSSRSRAARPAFRVRREIHLKDLETVVNEFMKSDVASKHENGLLAAQTDRLRKELEEDYRQFSTNSESNANRSPPLTVVDSEDRIPLLEEILPSKTQEPKGTQEYSSSSSKLISCNAIWNQLQSNPDFQDGKFDLDGLCDELRANARCSESGVMVDQDHVDAALRKLGKKDETGNPFQGSNQLRFEQESWDEVLKKMGSTSIGPRDFHSPLETVFMQMNAGQEHYDQFLIDRMGGGEESNSTFDAIPASWVSQRIELGRLAKLYLDGKRPVRRIFHGPWDPVTNKSEFCLTTTAARNMTISRDETLPDETRNAQKLSNALAHCGQCGPFNR